MATSTVDPALLTTPTFKSDGWPKAIVRAVRKNPVGALFGLVCVFLIFIAFAGPSIAPYDANRLDFPRLEAPSLAHPFGTDNLSRDLLSRILFGARNSIGVALAALAVAGVLGVVLGVGAGYIGGWFDNVTSRAVDIMLAYPAIVFVIFFVTIFGRNFQAIAVAIGIVLLPGIVRIIRSATIAIKHQPYIEAAILVGNTPFRIMYRHVLPNVAATVIVIVSVQVGVAILIEAALSFLGLGVSSATAPSWGRLLQEMRSSWQLGWWTMFVPGLAISVAVLAFNMFGDALRDWLDPRLRGTG